MQLEVTTGILKITGKLYFFLVITFNHNELYFKTNS